MKKLKSVLIIIFSISIIFSIFNIGKVLASVNTIKITNVQIKEKSTGVDASIVSYDNDDVKANVEYHKVNDYVIFNVTLKNNDTKKYTIKTITDDNLNGNIVYEYDKHENEEFNSNEEKVLEIKSTYKTEVNNMDKRVVNNSVKFNIIFIDEDGNESSKVIPINPKTGDSIGIYLLILIVSLIGLLSITIQKSKKIRSSLLIALLLIPITAQAANLNFIISFNENIKLYDKLLVKINGEEKIIPYNSKIDKPENPSKPGYTFDNWYSGNEVFDFTKEIKEDTTITPKFNVITYNINYDYAGGTATNPTTYTVEDKITLNNPTKAGYTFAGWTGTGITTQTTSVTIQKGSTEDRSYVAHFSTNQNTKYTVVHKYQKLDPTQYETEEVEEHGATDTEVAAPRKPKAGFETPEEQNVTITGDGEARVTYVYNRKTYTLNVTDRTYLDETSTANDTYPYETQVTLKAQEREGYTFKWSDDDTSYEKSFKLTENKELTLVYTPNDDTKYTVVHKYQKLDPTQYETEEVEEHGTTDETVPASRKPKAGFNTPEEQNIKITGDGEARVTYVYNRETYTFTINDSEYVDSTKESGNYPYETQITISPKERAGFTFTKWSDNTTDNPKTITLASNVTISPVYEANELDFNGDETISKVYSTSSQNVTINPASNGSGNYTYTITEGNTNNYFSISGTTLTIKENTPASEYTIKIKAKDNVTSAEKIATFKITITKQQSDAVTNLNVSPEGIVSFTNSANADGYLISIDGINYTPVLPGSETTTYNYLTQVTAVSGTRTVYVKAINSDSGNYDESNPVSKDVTVYKLSINVSDDTLGEVSQSSINVINGATYASSENKLTLSDEREVTTSKKTITGYTITFDGWSLENGTISQDTTITANYSKTINKYTVTFDTDGGSEVSSQTIEHGSKVTKPTDPTKTDYTFDNWYTTDSFETIFDFENTTITKDTTIYAKFDEIDKCKTFSTDSWSTIRTNLESNSSYYGVGCEKEVELDMDEDSTPESYTVRLANTSKPEVCNTPGYSQTACGTVIEFVDLVSKRGMNSTSTIAGGWKESEMVTYINSDFYDKLPNDLKEVIIPTYPIVSGSGSDKVSNDITKEDNNINKLYLLSAREAGFNLDNDNKKNVLTDTRTLDYYVGTSETIPDDKRSKSDLSGNHQYWWLRTPNSSFTKYYFSVNTGGAYANQYCYSNFGVAPAFRIGTPSVSNYTVTFDTDGGSEVSSQTIEEGKKVTKPTDPTKDGYTFDNWYTTDSFETIFDFENTTITSDTTIYAHFEELKVCEDNENITRLSENTCSNNENITVGDGIVCKRAVKLHEETCSQTDGTYYCSGAGYTESGSKGTSTITYGSCGTSGTLTSGDAFTCDVNGDGDFDELTERFYYVSDYYDTSAKEFDTSTAVLIYYNNVTSGVSCNKNTFAYDSSNENWHGPRTLVSQLPTTSQWSNVSLKSDTRAILAEYQSTYDSPTTAGGTLPTDFSYKEYAARLLTAKELMSGCNLTEVGEKTTGELDSCNYIMENTRYAKSTIGSAGHWLETPYAFDSYSVWYVGGYYHSVHSSSTNNTNFGGARPAIEVPKSKIEYGASSVYTVTLNANGGSEISDIKVDAGDSINELPTPTKDGYIFLGWFEKTTDENPVSTPYTPSGDIELIAKWQKMICKKATTLNTEICNSPSGKGCRVNGHSIGDTISYGNVITSDSLVPGDALDCDVDGTGYNQRFYYVTDNGNNAVLISYTTFSGDLGQSDINVYYNYDTSLTLLPTTTQWSNLPVKFEIQSGDYRPARMIKLSELEAMTGKTYSELQTDGALNDYEFLYENSLYSGVGERSTVWLEQTTIGGTDTRIRYRNDTRKLDVVSSDKYNSSNNCIKPIIEVPYNLIEDSYIIGFNPNGGVVSNKYANIQKGEKIGTLPTATRNDYIFAGWYTSLDFTIPVNENTIPNGYVTYYAKWLKPVEEAQLEHDSFNLNIDESKTINVLNSHELENYTFTSSNSEVASVTNAGVITGVSVGEATITMRGTVSDTTKEIHVNVQQEGTTYNVEFDSQGGEEVESINVNKNTAIGILPVTTKENKLFVGWYTSLEYTEKITETTIIDSDKKYYARWADADDVAEMNNEFYKSIQTAVNTAPTTKTTITLLQDVSINAFINMFDKNTNKDIVLDLNNHTLTGTAGQTIKTKIPLEIKNGTVIQTSSNGTIDIGPGGHLIINNGRVENSGGRAAIYNDGGTVEIGGDVYLTSNAEFASGKKRGTVQNESGTTIITGGTIINTRSSSSYAVSVKTGTFTLGTQDGIYNTSSITLQGNTNGIYSDVNYSVYDGVIKGKDAAVNNESKITSTEANSTKINTEEATYKVLYYNIELSKYEITLNPDGGEVNPTLILVDQGNKVGTLPTPSKGIYTFDGWYNESNEAVDENTVPTKNETYTAKWIYDVNPNVVSFRTTPDAQKTYYQYIDTWKNSASNFPSWSSSNNSPNWPLDATENTLMMQNFNNNNCMCADGQCSSTGTVHCDKPKGYNTGVNGKVSVYTYNETSGEKDTKVTYAKGDNGVIYNLIPDKVYYWELDSDEDVHGLVKFTSERRIIDAGDVLNVRDLGGLPADTDGDNIPDATLAYGRLFRGIKLNSSSSITELTNLGINSELDLREANSDAYKISRYNRIEAQNYFVNPNGETDAEKGYYTMTRNAVKYAMEEIVAGNNLYYHCRIGTDRTGTVSYVLEGLLGVPEEDRVQDYELSFFYGLVRIHRYHNEKPGSNVGTGKERFVYMHNFMPTNSDIYNWYMQGTTNQTEDEKLIEDFRNAMIEK